MKMKSMKRSNLMVLVCMMLACGGCASMNEAWMKGYVAVHDAADAALSNKVDHLPDATNMVPVTVKPDAAKGCGCDLSKPCVVFASPVHGEDEAAVGAWLRQRWVGGKRDSCDGLPRDVRPQALNPSGKGPFNWKYGITDGKIGIRFEGDNMAVTCGDVTVDGQTQRWHVVGCTNTEEGRKAADWKPMQPGVMTAKKHFVCFELR
jgi:hypothetical protein